MIQRTGKSDTAVVGWGRGMGHKGHMLLARAVIVQAQNMGADPYFFVSRTVGADDPLYPEEKLYIYKKVFPKQANIFQSATDDIPDINKLLTTLAQMGYKNAVLVVGADQVKAFQYLVGQNKAGEVVYKTFGLNNLQVIKRQDVDDAAQSEEGPRATPMRDILKDPNASDEQKFAVWRDAMPDALSDQEVLALMQKASQRMGEFKPATKKAKVKEFIQRVRPMLKEATLEKKLQVLKLIKEAIATKDKPKKYKVEVTFKDGKKDYVEIEHTGEEGSSIAKLASTHRIVKDKFPDKEIRSIMDPSLEENKDPFNLPNRHSMDYGMRKTMIRRIAKVTDYDVSDLSLASDEELSELYTELFPNDSLNEDYLDEK